MERHAHGQGVRYRRAVGRARTVQAKPGSAALHERTSGARVEAANGLRRRHAPPRVAHGDAQDRPRVGARGGRLQAHVQRDGLAARILARICLQREGNSVARAPRAREANGARRHAPPGFARSCQMRAKNASDAADRTATRRRQRHRQRHRTCATRCRSPSTSAGSAWSCAASSVMRVPPCTAAAAQPMRHACSTSATTPTGLKTPTCGVSRPASTCGVVRTFPAGGAEVLEGADRSATTKQARLRAHRRCRAAGRRRIGWHPPDPPPPRAPRRTGGAPARTPP